FDKDSGDVVFDSSGNGRNGKLVGATRVQQADGWALSLDGFDDHVDFGDGATLGAGGPISIELWIKPTRPPHGEAVLFGEACDSDAMPNTSTLLTFYNGSNVYWYSGNGGNNIRGGVEFDKWNHVVATFDGKQMCLWINGRRAAERESRFTKAAPRG